MPAPVPSVFIFADALAPNPPQIGLDYSYFGGNILTTSGFINVPESTLLLPDDAVSYVECDDSGVVSSNTNGFTPGAIPMAKVQTIGGFIRRWTDRREPSMISDVNVPGGGGGGGGGVTRYTHNQASPASTWVINHGLGALGVQITVVNGSNDVMYGDVTYISATQAQVAFGRAYTGKAFVQ